MRKVLMAGAAVASLVGGAMGGVAPASAQSWHGDHFRGDFHRFHDRDRFDGDDLAFGLLGLGIGAALASRPVYYDYPPGYYYGPGYGPYAYGTCYSRRWVWDPYWGRYVLERVRYAC